MALKNIASVAAVAAGLVAGQVGALSSPAAADGWRDHGGYKRHHGGPRYEPYHHRGHVPYHAPRRDRTGDKVGAAILGIGALIVGAAIADAARRERRERHDDRYED
jgi:hypothetical protein